MRVLVGRAACERQRNVAATPLPTALRAAFGRTCPTSAAISETVSSGLWMTNLIEIMAGTRRLTSNGWRCGSLRGLAARSDATCTEGTP